MCDSSLCVVMCMYICVCGFTHLDLAEIRLPGVLVDRPPVEHVFVEGAEDAFVHRVEAKLGVPGGRRVGKEGWASCPYRGVLCGAMDIAPQLLGQGFSDQDLPLIQVPHHLWRTTP